MGISGNLKTMALAELLQWLSQGQKTGTLVIEGPKVTKRVFFEGGKIVSSASTDPKEYLGHFLVAHGYLTEQEVDAAVARQEEEKQLLGQILVGMGALTEEQLQEVLHQKCEEGVYDIFDWEEGEFVFLDDDLPEETFIRMQMDVQWIVLEGSRRKDEWARVREWVPSELAVPVLVYDASEIEMDEVDRRILEWVDDDRTVEEISQGAQTSLFMISQIVAKWAEQGVLKVVRARIVEVPVPAKEVEAAPAAAPQAATDAEPPAPPPQQMPQGYPQMMPPHMMPPMGYPGMPQGYPPYQQMGAHPGFAAQMPAGGSGAAGGNVDVGGRMLHFAGGGSATPPAPPGSEAEALLQDAETALRQGDLAKALVSFRKSKDADGAGPSVQSAAEDGEKKVGDAAENEGVNLSAVPKLKCGMEELTQLDISPQEGFMLTRVDGSYDIKSILKMSPMPKVDALVLFWRLRRSGHVSV